jgi:HEPN domain-containing protein
MSKEEKIGYWVKSSGKDWKVANHLFEKGDYAYALFFGHLTIEKLLKAIFVKKFNEVPPYTHRLVFLAEKVDLGMSSERLELLEVITDFHLEARYPDEKFSFFKKCTREFTDGYLKKIGGLRRWLLKQVPSRKLSRITSKH